MDNQRGTFTIEFALVAVIFVFLLAFTSDIVINQSTKGRLDRLSYSIVNIIKERTQLYNDDDVIDSSQIDQMYSLIDQSLKRTMGSYDANQLGVYFEQQKFDSDEKAITPLQNIHLFSRGQLACTPNSTLISKETLSPTTSWGRRAVLYKVTICYQGANWFGELVGKDYSLIRSSSIMLGR